MGQNWLRFSMANRMRAALIIATFSSVIVLIVLMGVYEFPIPLPTLPITEYMTYITILLVILATKLILEIFKPIFRRFMASKISHEADIYALFQLISYLVWAAVLLAILFTVIGGEVVDAISVGLPLAALIVVLQKPLLNLVGWGVLVARRLYKLGDRIEINNVRGYVTQITLMTTLVREFGAWMAGDTFTGRYVSIPNSYVLEGNVYNYTRDTEFIWDELTVSVTYESDHKVAEKYIRRGSRGRPNEEQQGRRPRQVRVRGPGNLHGGGAYHHHLPRYFIGGDAPHILLSLLSPTVLQGRDHEADSGDVLLRSPRRGGIPPHGGRPLQDSGHGGGTSGPDRGHEAVTHGFYSLGPLARQVAC